MKKIIICLIVFSLTIIANAQESSYEWRWQNPATTTGCFYDIGALDANTAMAVGNGGVIVKTTDGGETWDTQYQGLINFLGKRYLLYSIALVDDNHSWVVGDGGTILKTNNGGETWSIQYTDQYTPTLYGLFFADTLFGWTTGIYSGDTLSQVLRTDDGGRNWVTNFTAAGKLLGVYFLDNNTGWVVGMDDSHATGVVYKTTDSGENWESTLVGPSASETMFYSVYFKDSNNGWIVGQYYSSDYCGVVYQTTDGGDSWSLAYESTGYPFYKISFTDDTYGWISGEGKLLRTSDGGASWEIVGDFDGSTAFFVDANTGWQGGYYGYISKTTDGGQNWLSCEHRACDWTIYLRGVDFIDEMEGWAVGHDKYTNIGIVLHTTDGGTTWQEQDLGSIADTLLFDVHFNGPDNGWILAFNGTILHTTDGGDNWAVQYDYPTSLFRSSYFIDDLNGWVVDDNFGVHKTTDGGDTWTVIDVSETGADELWPISFVDELYGWIAGLYDIIKTTDGGSTWQVMNQPPVMETIADIAFVSRSVGYLVCDDGEVYKTIDGGDNWLMCSYPPTFQTNLHLTLCFINENEGWIGCALGNICHTTDGGESWERIATSPTTYFRAFAAPTDSTIWVVGTDGAILKYSSGSAVGLTYPAPIPVNISLMQNYPNPFNATTSINFSLVKTGEVTLSIYDVLGRRVKTLYDGTLAAGSHSVIWDGKNESGQMVASGMYMYSLVTGEDTYVKKMVMLK